MPEETTTSGSGSTIPKSFGQFDVLDVLGTGGMGIVYRAKHRQTGDQVAIKTVSSAKGKRIAGIRSEIVGLSRLKHDGIVKSLAHGVENGVPWYAMELLEGHTLDGYLDELWQARHLDPTTTVTHAESSSQAPADATSVGVGAPRGHRGVAAAGRLQEVLRVFIQICEPLSYLHGRGVVHRDLKPSNVFLRREGKAVLVDFGLIARARGSVGREALEFGGRLLGTVQYLSPEQIRGETIDARSDLYALGCMLYEAVTGAPPFSGSADDVTLAAHQVEPPKRPSSLVYDVPEKLDALILALLAKRRRDRIGHADDVARTLAELCGEKLPDDLPSPVYLYRPEVVGREAIVQQVTSLLERLKQRQGSMALFVGESGVGKTFLAAEISRLATVRGLRVVAGECSQPTPQVGSQTLLEGRNLPLGPFRPLLSSIADFAREGGPERVIRLLGPRAKVIEKFAPELMGLPGLDEYPVPADLPGDEAHRRLIDSLREVIVAFAKEGPPLLLVLDDLQWADELSIKLLAGLHEVWSGTQGLMILGTARSEEMDDELAKVANRSDVERIEVGRLSAETIGQMAADMLAVPRIPTEYAAFLAQHAEGVPFFVAEYLRLAVAERLLTRAAGRWVFKGGALDAVDLKALPIPPSIKHLMIRRLAGLNDELKTTVEVASVVGRQFSIEVLAAACQLSEDEASERARDLVQRQILDVFELGCFRFAHDKLRETAYGSLQPEQRELLHREVARLLEALLQSGVEAVAYGELAHHFTQGKLWDKAIDYLEKAGEHAFGNFAHNEASGFFAAAIDLTPRASIGVNRVRQARWQRFLVDSHLSLGKMPAAHVHAQQALNLCGYRLPNSGVGWVVGFLGQVLLRVIQRAWPSLFRARSEERRQLIDEAAYVLNRLCEPFFLSHKPIQGFYCGFRDLNLAERVPASEALARGYATMAMVVGVGPLTRVGRAWSERAIRIARELGDQNAIIYCLSRGGVVLATTADWQLGIARLEEAVASARARSDLRQLGEALTCLAMLAGFKGDFPRALSTGQEILEIGSARGDQQLRHWGRNLIVHSLLRLGRAREVPSIVRQMLEYHKTGQIGEAEKIFDHGGFALMHLMLGELSQAREHALLVLDASGREPFLPYFLKSGLDGMGEALLGLLERADRESPVFKQLLKQARTAIRRLEKFAGLYRMASPRTTLLRGRLLWEEGRSKRAFSTWQRALAAGEQLQIDYDVASARFEIGRHLRTSERRQYLQQALSAFEQLGCEYDSNRARIALAEDLGAAA